MAVAVKNVLLLVHPLFTAHSIQKVSKVWGYGLHIELNLWKVSKGMGLHLS